MKEVYFVSETKPVNELFEELRKNRKQIATYYSSISSFSICSTLHAFTFEICLSFTFSILYATFSVSITTPLSFSVGILPSSSTKFFGGLLYVFVGANFYSTPILKKINANREKAREYLVQEQKIINYVHYYTYCYNSYSTKY